MHPETFEHHAAVYEYAEQHGLAFAWEGTTAFEKRLRTLAPEQYEILAVHTRRGITRVLLFSKAILKAEFEAANPPLDEASRSHNDALIAGDPEAIEREIEHRRAKRKQWERRARGNPTLSDRVS